MKRKLLILVAFLAAFMTTFLVMVVAALASWIHLGGDPLVPGGVHSKSAVQKLLRSTKGTTAMTYAGLSAKERAAVKNWSGDDRHIKSCTLHYGDFFVAMSFHFNGTFVDHNVTFADPRFRSSGSPAWCLNVPVVGKLNTTTLHIKIPEVCGNFGLMKRTKHRRHGKVFLQKKTYVDGQQTTPTTGMFHFKATWKNARRQRKSMAFTNGQKVKLVLKKVPTNHNVKVCEVSVPSGWTPDKRCITQRMPTHVKPAPTLKFIFVNRKTTKQTTSVKIVKQTFVDGSESTPQDCGFDFVVTVNGSDLPQVCNHAGGTLVDNIPVGATVKVCEVNIPSGWTPDQTCITQAASSSVTTFTFANRKTTQQNHKPTGTLILPQHMYVNGKGQVCVNVSDPDGDPINLTMTFQQSINDSSGTPTEWGWDGTGSSTLTKTSLASGTTPCFNFTAASYQTNVTVVAYIDDGQSGQIQILDQNGNNAFPVLPDQF